MAPGATPGYGQNTMKQYKYMIIGGGMAADAAVKGIRAVDSNGTIGIVGAEPDPPYARPPLSKGLWKGDKKLDAIDCGTEQKGAELLCGRRAVSLSPGQHEVGDDRGTVYRYERLLLATGGAPRRLPIEGADEQVLYYRTRADYLRLRKLAETADHIAVLGGGFIGAELAAALRLNDKRVTMVFPESGICGLMLPGGFAARLNRYYEDRGVTVVTGNKPSAIESDHGVPAVRLENGHVFSVDGIVAGIGVTPATNLAAQAGLEVDDGIVVDDRLKTRDADVFAAGDVARYPDAVLKKRRRVEHEDNALTMGERAGRNMAGEDRPYDHLPFFYSDLFDAGYEAIGETHPSYETVTDLESPEDKGCIFYTHNGRVRGIVFWNLFGQVDAGRELIAAEKPHSKDALRAWQKEHGD